MIRNGIASVKAADEPNRAADGRLTHATGEFPRFDPLAMASIGLRYNARELKGGVSGVVPA